MAAEQMKLIKIGGDWCGPCKAMERNKTLEKFAEKFPDVKVEKYTLYEDPKTAEEKAAHKAADTIADKFDVQSLPTILLIDKDGTELVRSEEAISLRALSDLYEETIEELEEDEDDSDDDSDADDTEEDEDET